MSTNIQDFAGDIQIRGTTFIKANTGTNNLAIGTDAGNTSQGDSAIAVGNKAGSQGQNTVSIAIGTEAGQVAQGERSVALGEYAGQSAQGCYSIAVGANAGQEGQNNFSIAIGTNAGCRGQDGSVAIGASAGESSQSYQATAVGSSAGQSSQGSYAIAVGVQAGQTDQGSRAIAIGSEAGATSQGTVAIAVGRKAGETEQGNNAIAVGWAAGQTSQGSGATAVGYLAGQSNQELAATAVGWAAGQTSQGSAAVAVGIQAGQTSQGDYAIAVGRNAGQTGQGSNATALGDSAGETGQGNNAIAVGNQAGKTSQADNSIILNATGSEFNTTTASSFHVKPVRGGNFTANVLAYTSTGEIVEETGTHFDSSGNVGIGKTNPGTALDVNGTVTATSFIGALSTSVSAGQYLTGGAYDGSTARTFDVLATTTNTASNIVARDSNRDIFADFFRSDVANQGSISGAMAFRINNTDNNYIRFCSDKAAIRSFLEVPKDDGTNASGTSWNISIDGNAGSASNVRVDIDGTGDTTMYLTMVSDSNAGNSKRLYMDSGLVYDNINNELRLSSLRIDDYIYHAGDTDTYFGFNGNDNFRIVGGGGTRFQIDSSGNVGIGADNPAQKLDVAGRIRADSMEIDDYIYHVGDTDTYFGFDGGDHFRIVEGGGTRFQIDDTGNVGIGTTSPTSKLEIMTNDDTGTSNTIALRIFAESSDHTNIADGFGSRIRFDTNRGTNAGGRNPSADIKGYIRSGAGTTGDYHALDLDVYGNDGALNPGISIVSTSHIVGTPADTLIHGNVGIGADNPAQKLDVAGRIRADTMEIDSYIYHVGDTNTYFGFDGNDSFKIVEGGGNRFQIDSNGNVGIGTYNPDQKLEVNGRIKAGSMEIFEYIYHVGDTDTYFGFEANDLFKVTASGGGTLLGIKVDSSGRVGMGTVTPGKKLDVRGTLRCDELYYGDTYSYYESSSLTCTKSRRSTGDPSISFTINAVNQVGWIPYTFQLYGSAVNSDGGSHFQRVGEGHGRYYNGSHSTSSVSGVSFSVTSPSNNRATLTWTMDDVGRNYTVFMVTFTCYEGIIE